MESSDVGNKGWAFLSEHGKDRISAYRVKELRDEVGGRPLGIPFWRAHHAVAYSVGSFPSLSE